MKSTEPIGYKVNEIFYSIQGEGFYTGTPAVFVRLSGCNRRCPFCDTDHEDGQMMSAREIVDEVNRYPATHIVLTGGEPAMWPLDELLSMLKQAGKYIQIETNGSLQVSELIDWVTCSPKDGELGIARADEVKFVYQGQSVDDIDAVASRLGAKVRCLQPCSGANIPETVAFVKAHPHWRLSLQTHKLISIP